MTVMMSRLPESVLNRKGSMKSNHSLGRMERIRLENAFLLSAHRLLGYVDEQGLPPDVLESYIEGLVYHTNEMIHTIDRYTGSECEIKDV